MNNLHADLEISLTIWKRENDEFYVNMSKKKNQYCY